MRQPTGRKKISPSPSFVDASYESLAMGAPSEIPTEVMKSVKGCDDSKGWHAEHSNVSIKGE